MKTIIIDGYELTIGRPQPAPAFGIAGNSRYSDYEIPVRLRLPDGTSRENTVTTEEGALDWLNRVIKANGGKA